MAKYLLVSYPEAWGLDEDFGPWGVMLQLVEAARAAGYEVCIPQWGTGSVGPHRILHHLAVDGEAMRRANLAACDGTDGMVYEDYQDSAWGRIVFSMPAASLFVALGPLQRDQTLLLMAADHARVPILCYVPGRSLSDRTISDYGVCTTPKELCSAVAAWHPVCQPKQLIEVPVK